MAQKTVYLEGVGAVLLAKRRGTRNIRLSVRSDGTVRVGLPAWLPYSAGLNFAKNRQDWINEHIKSIQPVLLKSGNIIGKSYVLNITHEPTAPKLTSRIKMGAISITTPVPPDNKAVQAKVQTICERALKQQAQQLLPARLDILARQHSLGYKRLRIVKLKSRWGSCSSDKTITLSYYLVQLPWDLIDYVIIHELLHTKHLNHGPAFWAAFESITPNAKNLKKAVTAHSPAVFPVK